MQIVLSLLMGISSRFAGDMHVSIMLTLLLFNGICRAVNQPARQTLMPMLVPARHFPNAITWNATLFETSNVVGPVASGLALLLMLGQKPEDVKVTWAYSIIYWVNGLCQLIQWGNILRINLPQMPVLHDAKESMFSSIRTGVRFVYGNKVILSAITLDMFAVLLGGATALLPVFAQHVLHVGPLGYNVLRATPSVGAVCMAIVLAHSPPMKHAGRNLLIAVTGFGLAIIVFGLSRNFVLSLVALFVTGVFDNISVVVRHSMVQLLTPDSMRGRVNSVNTVFISSSNELGEFESGTTAHIAQSFWGLMWGTMIAAVAGGAGTILVVIIAALCWPQLRAVRKLEDLKQSPLP
jgi:MFS family permease